MPPTDLTFTETSDPTEAKAWFAGLTERNPQALSVIASVADSLLADPQRYADPRWWAGREGGEVGDVAAAFMHTPPHPLHVGWATPAQACALARHLAENQAEHQAEHQTAHPTAYLVSGRLLPGVGGAREAAQAFAAAWSASTGATWRTAMEMGVYDLPAAPALPFEVEGSFGVAGDADLPLVDAWSVAFARAVDHRPREVPTLSHAVAEGRVGLWHCSGRVVSMAYASQANGGVTRVSGVWTPPELRGHGYASAVVAALSRMRMETAERCMLFTDLANPTSNAIYQAIGYRRIGDNISIEFA